MRIDFVALQFVEIEFVTHCYDLQRKQKRVKNKYHINIKI